MNVSKYYWVWEEQPWIGTPSPYDDPTDRNESIHLVVLVPAGGEYEYKRMYWALTRHLAPPPATLSLSWCGKKNPGLG